jgi:peptide/nickel transport system permease protein
MNAFVAHRPRVSLAGALPLLRSRRLAALWVGCGMLGMIVLAAVFAPLLSDGSPNAIHPEAILASPSWAHPFGTDQFGRDIFARALFAARVDLLLVVALVATAFVIGTTIGVLGAWRGGWPDTVLTRVIDIALAFPFLVLVLSVVGMRGPGLTSLYLAVSLVAWVFYARIVREEVVLAKNADYMLAARASDFSTPRTLIRHLLPNVIVQPTLYASSDCTYALLVTASVSFLGAGVQPPQAEWGQMVAQGTQFFPTQWWMSAFPALAIVFSGVAFALVADGLTELSRRGMTA